MSQPQMAETDTDDETIQGPPRYEQFANFMVGPSPALSHLDTDGDANTASSGVHRDLEEHRVTPIEAYQIPQMFHQPNPVTTIASTLPLDDSNPLAQQILRTALIGNYFPRSTAVSTQYSLAPEQNYTHVFPRDDIIRYNQTYLQTLQTQLCLMCHPEDYRLRHVLDELRKHAQITSSALNAIQNPQHVNRQGWAQNVQDVGIVIRTASLIPTVRREPDMFRGYTGKGAKSSTNVTFCYIDSETAKILHDKEH